MSFTVRIDHNYDKLEQVYSDLIASQRRVAAYSRGLNKAIEQVRTQWVRHVVKTTQLPYAYVRQANVIFRASPGRPIATLTVSGRHTTLFKYALASGGKPGLVPGGVIAGKWGMHRGAFMFGTSNKHVGVFRRVKGDDGKSKLRELWGPAVPRPLLNPDRTALGDGASSVINVTFSRVIMPLVIHELHREVMMVARRHGL